MRACVILLFLAALPTLAGAAAGAPAADTVTITGGPSGETTSTTATFTFTGEGAVTHFRCQIDTERAAVGCTSPATYTGLPLGTRTFTVEGYRGDVPVGVSDRRTWTIVAPPPPQPTPSTVTITAGPSGETTETTATFSFAGTGEVTGFRCRLDQGASAPCTSPAALPGLAPGEHTFTVEGFRGDVAVNISASRTWTVVAAPPPPKLEVSLEAPPIAPPSSVVLVDASAGTGPPVQALAYDLDGNGAFETACAPGSSAGVAFASPGTYTVGALVVAADGSTAAGKTSVKVSGGAQPASGQKPLAAGSIVGGCLATDAAAAAAALVTCPKTVVVGVAEATIPPGAPKGACFAREILDGPLALERFAAPPSQTALVNGLRLTPSKGSRIVAISTVPRVGVVPGTARVGAVRAKPGVDIDSGYGPLSWDVTKAGAVGQIAVGGFDDRFLGLLLPELTTPVTLTTDRRARLDLRVQLPKPFERAASGVVKLTTDNTAGPVIQAFSITIAKIPIGPLALENVKASYKAEGAVDVWAGSFALRLPPAPTGPVVKSLVEVRNGTITRAEVEMSKQNPGWGPIACCIYLTRLKGWYQGPDPKVKSHYAIGAEADLTAGPKILGWSLLKLTANGRLHWHPDYGAVIEVGGELILVEKFPLVKASLFAKMGLGNTWVSFEATADWDMVAFTAKGVVGGEIGDPFGKSPGSWYVGGGVSLCIAFVDLCAGGKVAASSKGAAGCLYVDLDYTGIAAGAVYYWNGDWSTFWGCSKEKLKSKVGAAGVGEAESLSFEVPPGMRSFLVRVTGAGGAPRVAVIGPDGRRIVTPGPGEPTTDRRTWLAVAVPTERATYVDIGRPAAGRWRVEALAGSVPLRGLAVAEALPARIVSGSVTGSGELRRLRYRTVAAPGQAVVLSEVGGGVRRAIGTTSAAAGEITFSPGDGVPGVRTIEATVLRDGLAIRTERVARFRVGTERLPAPRVTLARTARGVTVRWTPVPGAAAYRVVAGLSDGRRLTLDVRGTARSAAIPSLGPSLGVTASVRGVSSAGRDGNAGGARLRPPARVTVEAPASIGALLSGGALVVHCALPADGTCRATFLLGGRAIGSGAARGRYGTVASVRLVLTPAGRTALSSRRGPLAVEVDVPGEGVRRVKLTLP